MSEQEQNTGPQFSLQRIYLRDSSFESPKAPETFRGQWTPKVNLELNSRYSEIEPNLYEVVLGLTVTTKNESDEVMYLVEVQQAGLFAITGFEGDALTQALGSFCPSVLFPYAREAIDGLVIKGSFPALMLAPVNFDAILEQIRTQRAQEGTTVQ
jgi:preprotein translocase subunit SecB